MTEYYTWLPTLHEYEFTLTSFPKGNVLCEQIRLLFPKLKHYLLNFNVFPSVPPSTDEHELRNQRISTRIFIVLLILSTAILLLYTSLVTVTKTINVQTPNLEKYSQLYSTYSRTLTCPCTKISVDYGKFLRIEHTLHQVCSSIFSANDFRWISPSAFRTLMTLCDLINSTISDSLTQFYSNQYISASITPPEIFKAEAQLLTDQLRSSTTNSFSLSLSMIQKTTKANNLFSAVGANYIFFVRAGSNDIHTRSESYGNCSCASSSTCIFQSILVQFHNPTILFSVPGFYGGCYVIDGLLLSTLQCFFNQTCIDVLQTYLPSSSGMNVSALDSSLPSEYSENSTVKELVDKLMIEKWNLSLMYHTYYNQCQPMQCTYTIERRNDVIYIVTTLIGLVGGLMTILKLIVPRVVRLITKKKELPQPSTGK
jgi:hypothetical protein